MAAMGSVPCPHNEARRQALSSSQQHPSTALDQVNIPKLFQSKQLHQPMSLPRDEADWLACNAEEGQSFDDYVRDLTLRSGRFRSHAGMDRLGGIVLVPIVRERSAWPKESPPLEELKRFVQAFFHGTSVTLCSSPAVVKQVSNQKKRMEWKPPSQYHSAPERWVTMCQTHQRLQVSADSLLTCLTDLTNGHDDSDERPFCVVGVTMEDLYAANADLFIAGVTAGRSHVAVLSFFRYHPNSKMGPNQWWKYGYSAKPSSYSYFEPDTIVKFVEQLDKKQERKRKRSVLQLLRDVPKNQSPLSGREVLKRASKLLAHEILHIYQVDHCIYYKCLMNGTGHLVEDFAAPPHLCGIDVRKLQYRLGFDVAKRYEALAKVYESWKCTKEAKWYRQREKEAARLLADRS